MATDLMRTAFKDMIFKSPISKDTISKRTIFKDMALHIRLPPTLLRTGSRKPNLPPKPRPLPKMQRAHRLQTPTLA